MKYRQEKTSTEILLSGLDVAISCASQSTDVLFHQSFNHQVFKDFNSSDYYIMQNTTVTIEHSWFGAKYCKKGELVVHGSILYKLSENSWFIGAYCKIEQLAGSLLHS